MNQHLTLDTPPKQAQTEWFSERKNIRYLLWLDRVYSKISNIPGHIVELGVAKGRNSLIFGHLIHLYGDEHVRCYYGFDTFDGYTEEDLAQSPYLNANRWKDSSLQGVAMQIAKAGLQNTSYLVEGDIKKTVPSFLTESRSHRHSPGCFKAALLYIDCNAYLPAITGMEQFREYMVPGGIICIDECRQGGETKALIEFCRKYDYPFCKDESSMSIPAYTIIS